MGIADHAKIAENSYNLAKKLFSEVSKGLKSIFERTQSYMTAEN